MRAIRKLFGDRRDRERGAVIDRSEEIYQGLLSGSIKPQDTNDRGFYKALRRFAEEKGMDPDRLEIVVDDLFGAGFSIIERPE